ncbi:MAG: N-acetylmuramoyl-L-alanine amidase, partial [Pseudomonadota bacterium]
LEESVGVIRSRPLRSADFRVLKAPDIPSVLLELGFLGHEADRGRLQDRVWQEQAAGAVSDAVIRWWQADGGAGFAAAVK